MSLTEKSVISTHNMSDNAAGLADFIREQINVNIDDRMNRLVVYVMDEEGNHVTQAKLEEVTLSDGSKVYNIVLKLDS